MKNNFDKYLQQLNDNRIFLNYGPMQIALDVQDEKSRSIELEYLVGQYLIEIFNQTKEYFIELKKGKLDIKNIEKFPIPVQKMIQAVKYVGIEEMTYLSAVAGSFSESALEKAISLGAKRVIINNGGDIALKDVEGKKISVGIPIKQNSTSSYITIDIKTEDDIQGICTSGFGGRSFTKGVANSAVVLASKASIADVCATYLGNQTNVESTNVIRCLAEEIDSGTDIVGHQITLKVGNLTQKEAYRALLSGYNSAELLYNKGIIKGSIIVVKNEIITIPDNIAKLKK